MARRRSDPRERIARFRELCDRESPEEALDATRKALGDRAYLLVSKAAELAGERLLYDLEPDLIAAHRRFLEKAAKTDPGCTAKGAIVRALVALDCQDVDFFLQGLRYRQPEPVWGGTVDTAVDLRTSCAAGLAATAYPRALVDLVELLHDPEPHARSGALRAIACTERIPAEAVLRSKALMGDPEPEVTADCFAALLQVADEEAVPFVDRFLDGEDPGIAEQAALALGESHLDAALELLRARWGEQPFKRESDRVLLRAAVLHRSDAAFDWLLEVVAAGDRQSAGQVIRDLAAYRGNRRLRDRLRQAVEARADEAASGLFREAWGA